MKIKIVTLIILGLLPTIVYGKLVESAFGDFTEITNQITTESNTGGNTVENGGTVVKGNAEASIKVKTEINGEEIENINIQIESDGEVKELIKEEKKISEDGKTSVETKVELKVEAKEETKIETASDSKQTEELGGQVQIEPVKEKNNFIALIIKNVVETIKNFFSWLG